MANGAVVDSSPVEQGAVEAAGVEPVGVAGVVRRKGVEGGSRRPLGDQRLQTFGTGYVAVTPGGDGEGIAEGGHVGEEVVGCGHGDKKGGLGVSPKPLSPPAV